MRTEQLRWVAALYEDSLVEENYSQLKESKKMGNWTLLPSMPEQHESIFAKHYGTEKWKPAMFRKCSDKMLVTVEFKDGTRLVCTGTVLDGTWKIDSIVLREYGVIAWMPFPEPCAL